MHALPIFLVVSTLIAESAAYADESGGLSTLPGIVPSLQCNPSLFIRDSLAQHRETLLLGKHFAVSGFLVTPLKAVKEEGFMSVPRRWLQAHNPFGASETKPAPIQIDNLSPEAWTTIVGWTPSAATFRDPLIREARMVLISVNGGGDQR